MSDGPARRMTMTPKLEGLGRALVMQLYMVLRTVRIHDPSNKALVVGTERLKDTINTLWAVFGGPVRLQFVEHLVYLNDMRLRTDASFSEQVASLRGEFDARGLGGFSFARPVDTAGLRALLELFAKPTETEEARAELKNSLSDLKALALEVLGPKSFSDDDVVEELRIDKKTFALQTYARAVVVVRELVTALQHGRDPNDGRILITRVVMDLIDVATERVNFLLRLAAIKQAQDYAYNHAANTCVLSLVIGKAMDLERSALVDLGTSALLADVPLAMVPPELMNQPTELTEQERAQIHALRIRHLRAMIGKRRMTDSLIRRVIVAYEHSLPYRNPTTKKVNNLHLFSRIVAIASAFDALTTRRPWREAYSADEALKIMLDEAGGQYDPLITLLFVNLMGIYPLGTAVGLDSGELAIVYHNSNDPRLFEKPRVKIIRDAEGRRIDNPIVRNLATHIGEGSTIVRVATAGEIADLEPGSALVF